MTRRFTTFASSLCAGVLLLSVRPAAPPSASIKPNDNRRAAGSLSNGVLTVRLTAGTGVWQPEGRDGPQITTAAFGETGKALQTPGPLLRVKRGTEIRASIHNALPAPLWIYGMGAARGYASDSFEIASGASREIRFRAGETGTYYYSGRTAPGPAGARASDDSQLNGVIVVDEPGRATAADRIFVVSSWYTIDTTSVSGLGPDPILAFNGLSWPHTEPLAARQGDTLTYRFVNTTPFEHPMHLHGFYFRVDARGDGRVDTTFAPADRRMAVTELLLTGETMAMTWSPTRSGNWILHCHLASHIAPASALVADRRMPSHMTVHGGRAVMPGLRNRGNPMQHNMAGLVLGIRVAPTRVAARSTRAARPIRLVIRSRAAVYGDYAGYSYVLGGSPEEADTTAMPVPGPVLVLQKDEPVAITIVNRSHENAAVHWHGIELESFPDGVAGWSGQGATTLPMIGPEDSLTVRFTPPRAGTFMYHSHSNEFQQIASGLYGAIVVVDSAHTRDEATDRVLLFSDDGPTINFLRSPPAALLNGRPLTDTLRFRAATPQRLRLINIRTDYPLALTLLDGDRVLEWRVLAKDGADLPVSRTGSRAATMLLSPGETADVEFTPRAGRLALKVTLPTFRDVAPVLVPVSVGDAR